MTRAPEPWERQPGDTDVAWQRFVQYRDMGLARPRAKAAELFGITESALDDMSCKYGWASRVRAWDAEVQRRADKATLEDAELRQRAHLTVARTMQKRGTMAIVEAAPPTAAEGARMASEGVRLERLILGAATARTETNLTSSVLALGDDHLEALTDEERAEWRRLVEKMAAAVGDGDGV